MMIQFTNVSVVLNGKTVLDDVSFDVNEGEFVTITGASGTGKTTLLRLLYFDLLPTKGTVQIGLFHSDKIRKREIPQLRKNIGIAFQDIRLLSDRSIFENVAFVMQVTKRKKDFIKERAAQVLTEVGLADRMNSLPDELSGGEQARAVLARALANQPEVLLVDEPTGNLDLQSGIEVLDVLKTINKKDTTIVMVSHNQDIIKQTGGRVLHLKEGKIVV